MAKKINNAGSPVKASARTDAVIAKADATKIFDLKIEVYNSDTAATDADATIDLKSLTSFDQVVDAVNASGAGISAKKNNDGTLEITSTSGSTFKITGAAYDEDGAATGGTNDLTLAVRTA